MVLEKVVGLRTLPQAGSLESVCTRSTHDEHEALRLV